MELSLNGATQRTNSVSTINGSMACASSWIQHKALPTHRAQLGGVISTAPVSTYSWGDPVNGGYPSNIAMVRSTKDPWMKALSITGETVNFGNTQSQNATIGGICLGIGVCCLIPCYIFAYLAYMMHKRSQQGGMDQAPAGNYGNNDTVVVAVVEHPPPAQDNPYTAGSYDQPPPAHGALEIPTAPPVPAGWEAIWDPAQQKYYYHNVNAGTTTWENPNFAPVAAPAAVSVHPYAQGSVNVGDSMSKA